MTSMAIGFSFWVLGFTIDAIDAIDYKIFFPPPVIDYKILIDVIKSVIDVPFIAVDTGITKSSSESLRRSLLKDSFRYPLFRNMIGHDNIYISWFDFPRYDWVRSKFHLCKYLKIFPCCNLASHGFQRKVGDLGFGFSPLRRTGLKSGWQTHWAWTDRPINIYK